MISRQTNGRHRYRTCMAIQICSCPYSIDRSTVYGGVVLSLCACVWSGRGGGGGLRWPTWRECCCWSSTIEGAARLLLWYGAWRGVSSQFKIAKERMKKNTHSKWKTEREKIKKEKLWKYAWIKNKGNSQIVLCICGKLLSWLNRLLSTGVESGLKAQWHSGAN